MKKDLEFNTPMAIQNKVGTDKFPDYNYHEFDLWQELIKQNDGKEFVIGHIIIWSTNNYSLCTNRFIKIGDKQYDLLLYNEEKSANSVKIYDFEKGYLSPLKIKVTKEMTQKISVSLDNPFNVSVSVV